MLSVFVYHKILRAAGYGMAAYGGADARSMYGTGYGGQAAQGTPYGASVPVSQYSGYAGKYSIP